MEKERHIEKENRAPGQARHTRCVWQEAHARCARSWVCVHVCVCMCVCVQGVCRPPTRAGGYLALGDRDLSASAEEVASLVRCLAACGTQGLRLQRRNVSPKGLLAHTEGWWLR